LLKINNLVYANSTLAYHASLEDARSFDLFSRFISVGRFTRDSYHFILSRTLSEADIIATLGMDCCASCGSRGEERCRLELAHARVVECSVLSSLLAGGASGRKLRKRFDPAHVFEHTTHSRWVTVVHDICGYLVTD
jgi:hypothetical protein